MPENLKFKFKLGPTTQINNKHKLKTNKQSKNASNYNIDKNELSLVLRLVKENNEIKTVI